MPFLLAPYGIAAGINSGSVTGTGTDGKQYNIAEAPLYFVRSGHVYVTTGRLENFGDYGYEWSSSTSASNGIYAYYFGFGTSGVSPSIGTNRSFTFPLRCLARL